MIGIRQNSSDSLSISSKNNLSRTSSEVALARRNTRYENDFIEISECDVILKLLSTSESDLTSSTDLFSDVILYHSAFGSLEVAQIVCGSAGVNIIQIRNSLDEPKLLHWIPFKDILRIERSSVNELALEIAFLQNLRMNRVTLECIRRELIIEIIKKKSSVKGLGLEIAVNPSESPLKDTNQKGEENHLRKMLKMIDQQRRRSAIINYKVKTIFRFKSKTVPILLVITDEAIIKLINIHSVD